MALFYVLPHWFIGYGLAFELLFGIVTGLLAYYSFKVYNLCDQKECKNLGWAFASISASYVSLLIIQMAMWAKINTSSYIRAIETYSLYTMIGLYLHVIFLLIGFATYAYVTLNLKNQRAYSLLISLSILSVIFSANVGLALNFISAVLLLYVTLHYANQYKKKHNHKVLLTLIGVSALLLARLIFAFTSFNPVLYALSHFIEFIGYTVMTVSLMKALR